MIKMGRKGPNLVNNQCPQKHELELAPQSRVQDSGYRVQLPRSLTVISNQLSNQLIILLTRGRKNHR